MSQDDKTIRGDLIKNALKQFDYFATSTREILIANLEQHNIVLDDKHYYSLKDIERRFTYIFGDATPLLVDRLKAILRDFKMLVIASLPTIQFGFICITMSSICFICNSLGMTQKM